MSSIFTVKEEYPGGSSSCSWNSSNSQSPPEAVEYWAAPPPRPMEGLHDAGPPPFLVKTFDMVDDLATNNVVSWSRGGQSFVVWDPNAFSNIVLPRYFKHKNFSSFVRQLNTYGFRKIDAEKWEFANEAFLRFQKHLLKNIRRRKAPSQLLTPPDEFKIIEQNEEIDRLRRDKRILTMEIVKLRHQHMKTRAHLKQVEMKIQGTEIKQQKMMSFLARAMQNPEYIDKLVRKRKELEEEGKKRRRMFEIKVEPSEFGEKCLFQVSELEALALEMQGYGKVIRDEEEEKLEEVEELGSCDEELDEGFWEELLNEGLDDEEGQEEDVNSFAHR
ncbi:hypothetical protein BUALT_Bualt13G0014400 [Buddleja alternifolia]|uniref:Heat stress transcription factor n=1 Tax=Buddleja alternifolia TaxID=168488 RepID=A0AAV6WQK5_9LAMI|nr:hypothetical protein BUALT_Bualt13G0014400 [Buddleja alternifolia]